MIEQIYTYFTIDKIYMWSNIGILPFWIILIFFSHTRMCKIFVTSIFPIFILSLIDGYLIFEFLINGFNPLDSFNLYMGLNELSKLFSDENIIILFWIHFLSINLFCGSWIVKDSQKLFIPKFLISVPIIITYFIGPFGIFVYWIIRIFFNKKITLYD